MEGALSSSRPVTALVFDMDGTLIDSKTVVPDSYIAAIRAAGGPTIRREQVIERYSLGPPRVLMSHFLERPATEREVNRYHEILANNAGRVSPYPGVREVLEELEGNAPLAVFTGASRRACDSLLRATSLRGFFQTVVGGDEVDHPKPEPDGIVLACDRLRVNQDEVAYVGDAPVDLEAARRCAVLAVAAAWGHQYSPSVHADVVAQHPRDLLTLVDASR